MSNLVRLDPQEAGSAKEKSMAAAGQYSGPLTAFLLFGSTPTTGDDPFSQQAAKMLGAFRTDVERLARTTAEKSKDNHENATTAIGNVTSTDDKNAGNFWK